MKITIEITVEEARMLLQHEEKPEITDEIHEDFEETDIKPDPGPKLESDLKPQPKPELARKKLKTKRGVRRDSKPIDVCDNGEWVHLASIKQAADHIGCSTSQVATALKKGHKCHGHEVRYHEEGIDENILPRGNGHE
ncbi:MAG: hypothetical protein IJL44_03210 [Bacteroidales bacterium]|nr:hypothetical protein [Bacteroidales bacterium]